jgi:long-chain acyl-CoA synthetase
VNVAQFLVNSAARFADRPAVMYGDLQFSYAEFNRRSASLAAAVSASFGIGRGDRVILYMDNRPELLEAMFAAFRVGAVVVPCNSRSTSNELSFLVADCGASLVVTDQSHLPVASAAAERRPLLVVGEAYESLLQSAAGVDQWAVADTSGDDPAWFFYTSGTTGSPKGAVLPHSALNFVTVAWHADLLPLDEEDVTLHVAPLTHGAGFHALAAVAAGALQVIPVMSGFDSEAVLRHIRELRVTNMWMVPTQIIRLTEAVQGSPPPPSLRAVVYGGAPIATPAIQKAIEVFGRIFVQLYGQGESPMTITALRAKDHVGPLLGTAGHCRMGVEVRIVDADDRPVPNGTVGEVVVRGPSLMSGYWGRPDASALKEGWLHTGDLGLMSDDAVLTLLDRTKDMIISGGSNVYAVEVEAVLASDARVREAAVVGVPDELWGERVEAVVVTGARDESFAGELDRLCRSALSDYKIPRCYHFVDELPRNAYGKVLKNDLRHQLGRLHTKEQ